MHNFNNIRKETISTIFIIAFVSLFILANFAVGFVLSLFVLAMAVAGAMAFFYPRSGAAATIFLTFIFERFFTLQPIIWGRAEYKLYPLDIILVAVLAGIVFSFFIKRGSASLDRNNPKRPNLKTVDFYLIAFIILSAIYFLISVFILNSDFNLSFSSFKHYTFYPLLYFAAIYLFNSKERILWLFQFALAGAVGIIFFIIYGLISGAGLWSEFTPLSTEGIRTLAFPHAFYLSLAIIGLITYLIFSKKDNVTLVSDRKQVLYEKLYWILILVWMIGIVGSMMRHLWISLFVSIAVLFLILPRKEKYNLKKIISRGAMLAIAFIILIVYFALLLPTSGFKDAAYSIGDIIESRVSSLTSVSGDESFSWRGVVWKEAARKYLESPILGIGFGNKIYVEIEKYKDFIEVRNIHNSPLVILVQMGIAATFAFLAFVYKNLKALYQKANKDWIDAVLLGMLIFYLTAFLFQPYLETNLLGIFFWIILGLIRSYAHITHQQI